MKVNIIKGEHYPAAEEKALHYFTQLIQKHRGKEDGGRKERNAMGSTGNFVCSVNDSSNGCSSVFNG